MDRKSPESKKPSLSSRLRELGNLRYKKKEYEKAEEMFSESIVRARESKNAEDEMLALSNRALTRMKQNHYEAALQDCDFSIDISNKTDISAEKAYFRRAQCLQKLGRTEKALNAFRVASSKISKSVTIKRCFKEIKKLESTIRREETKEDGENITDTKEETPFRTKVVKLNFKDIGSQCPSPHPATINADGSIRYCDACSMGGAINRCGRCKQTIYCSRNCQESHWPFHKSVCGEKILTSARRGKAGLNNVGNTCFLSSVVQCMSHTTPITRMLLGNRHVKDINRDNPLGTRDAEVAGEYVPSEGLSLSLYPLEHAHTHTHTHTHTHRYVSLLKKLWFSSRSSHSPLSLHKAIVRTRDEFVNTYSQQDSHELLMFLLDAIHEDLNRVRDKPYIEAVEDEGRPDRVVAEETWKRYLLRNRSIVVDYCTGQFKSTVTCPSCERVSVSFDPFFCATLPLIPASAREIKIKINLKRRRGSIETYELKLPANSKIRDLKQALATKSTSNLSPDHLYIVELYRGRHHKIYKSKNLIREIEDRDVILAHEFEKPSMGYRHMLVYTYNLNEDGEVKSEDVPALLSIPTSSSSSSDDDDDDDGDNDSGIKALIQEYRTAHLQNNKEDEILGISTNVDTILQSREDFQTLEEYTQELNTTEIAILVSRKNRVVEKMCRARDVREKKKDMTLSQCFDQFARPEKLDKDNKWYCSKCKDHFRATKCLEFWKIPDVLIVHLKRFKYRGGMGMFMGGGSNKISSYVDFPTRDLDMTSYVLSSSEKEEEEDNKKSYVYDLYAVTNHYGRIGYGHYTAFARDISDSKSKRMLSPWYGFDDEQCRSLSSCDESEIKTSAAYLLFYLRRPSGITEVEEGEEGEQEEEEEK